MSSPTTSLIQTRSNLPAPEIPRVNIVSAVAFLAPLLLGGFISWLTALHLRAMNMLYEGLKEKGALMLVPSSAVESMGMGGLLGAAALRQQKLTGSDEVPE